MIRQRARGFTLLEVMIAGVLLTIVSAGTLSAFSASHQMLLSAQYRLEAMNTARLFVETYEAAAFDNLTNATTTLTDPPRQVTTTVQNGPAGTDYKIVTVQVIRQPG